MNDLVLKGGRVVDPSQALDKVADIAFIKGKVAAIGDNLSGKEVRDVARKIVSPGLIDLHTHVYWGGTSLGVEAELLARTGGVTTFVDAGSAGPGNFHGFRKHVIEPSAVRILPYLNVAFPGIFAFSKSVMVGENADMRLIDAREAVRVAREHKDLVLGIKVRVGRSASGDSGVKPLDIALDVAEETGLQVEPLAWQEPRDVWWLGVTEAEQGAGRREPLDTWRGLKDRGDAKKRACDTQGAEAAMNVLRLHNNNDLSAGCC